MMFSLSSEVSFLHLSFEISDLKSYVKLKKKNNTLEAVAYPYGQRPTETGSSKDLSEM